MNLRHFSEFAPPCRPSQRQRYAFELSGTAPSLAAPAAQPLRALSSHAPSTGMNLWHLSEFSPPCRPSQRQRYAFDVSAIASSLGVPAEQPLRTLSSHTPSTERMKHLLEFRPPCSPSQRQTYPPEPASGNASSLGTPAEQPLRTLSLQTPSTGLNMWHLSEFEPPYRPSQRQRYAFEVSATASSLAVPAEQPLRVPSSHAPFTGTCLLHLPEFAPAFQPSQRHAYSVELSGKASSLGVPAEQPLRTLSSHTPATENHRAHRPEFCPPPSPSQRHWYATGWSGYAAALGVPAEQPLRLLSSQTPSTTSSTRMKQMRESCPPCRPSQRHLYAFDVSASAASLGVPAEQPLRTLSWHTPSTGSLPHRRLGGA